MLCMVGSYAASSFTGEKPAAASGTVPGSRMRAYYKKIEGNYSVPTRKAIINNERLAMTGVGVLSSYSERRKHALQ